MAQISRKSTLRKRAPAEPLNLGGLKQRAQQLGLQGHGESCYFIQKKRAAVGELDLPRARFGGSGKSATLAAEQFRLNEILRQCGAVQANIWLICAAAQSDDGAGGQLLPRPAFTPDKHVDAAAGHLLNCVVQQDASVLLRTGKILEPAQLNRLLPHALALSIFTAAPQRIQQGDAQFGDIDGAAKVRVSPGIDCLLFHGALPRPAHGDQREVLI